ncbi:MAG: TetM/TetW/TetO/TetS family tetracycline resistance ribosomal protection protein [Salinibacterium sp.]|nr:TetM/TetW/TetO/TetS family tetracycline resistance ribosomal protection protein [Salinibacterium sp.]
MRDRPIALGIVAHIDAGKTSLTERLLFETGIIERLGRVDAGTTQTDTNAIERRRGITIRAAVTSFTYRSFQVNVIDTPGHSEFVSEVQRALAVLDGVVLVISAVEGIQAHTKVLMKTLRRMEMSTLVFINKIDRHGAQSTTLLDDISRWLDVAVIPMNTVRNVGSPEARVVPITGGEDWASSTAELLADRDINILDALVSGRPVDRVTIMRALSDQTAAGSVCPLYFGSARTGEGTTELLDGIVGLLQPLDGDETAPPRGVVFAIERNPEGPKISLVRLESGQLRPREVLHVYRQTSDGVITDFSARPTSVDVVGRDSSHTLLPGDIGRVRGLRDAQVGDRIGPSVDRGQRVLFAPPMLETIVRAADGTQSMVLHTALVALAEQDPMINTRVLPSGETAVLLYGEIQKEVLEETLLSEFGVRAQFQPSSILHLERPSGSGSAIVPMGQSRFVAGIGFRVELAPRGSGITYQRETEYGSLSHAFHLAIEETVVTALQQGLHGWPVVDCLVTLIHSKFDSAGSTGGDFRLLTPIVVLRALQRADSQVFEPCQEFDIEIPSDCLSSVSGELLRLEATIDDTQSKRDLWSIRGTMPLRLVQSLSATLPGLTRGEGSCSFWPRGDRLVRGTWPERIRSDGNPLQPKEYQHYLSTRQHRSPTRARTPQPPDNTTFGLGRIS